MSPDLDLIMLVDKEGSAGKYPVGVSFHRKWVKGWVMIEKKK